MVTATDREAAAIMRAQLETERLEVVLTPSRVPEIAARGGMIRSVANQNTSWYREFCRCYLVDRRRPRHRSKPDTAIKRAHTLRALKEISAGQAVTIYAQRLLPFVRDFGNGEFR